MSESSVARSDPNAAHQTGTSRQQNTRSRGGAQGVNKRDGRVPGRGGAHIFNSRRDGRISKPRDPNDYAHLLIDTPTRTDHAGIKFRGQAAECDICCRQSDLFALGPCVHPICIECGIRLRVLCKIETCPKCRAVIDTLYFVPFPGDWSDYKLPVECVEHADAEKYKIKLANDYAARCYDTYLAHLCLICEKKGEKRVFSNFAQLNQHMYMVHRFEFCDICVEHLNLFTRERRFYSRIDLERHFNEGDSDDKSHKGHPQCLFCEKRFLDDEFRYKHLRRDHFFCQICDADGKSNYFFPEHRDLLKHYRAKHIICEEGECVQLGIAFRTDTELKLHKSRDHGAGPQTLNLDFHFSDRSSAGPSRDGRAAGRGAAAARSALPSQRNIPRIGLIPSVQHPKSTGTVDANDVRIVPSAQTERVTPSLRYAGTQFKLHGSDFPRLGKSAPSSGASGAVGIAQSSKSGAKTQKAIVEETVAASDSCGPNAASSSSSWFIDDDEQFPPHRSQPSNLAQQQSRSGEVEKAQKDRIQDDASSGMSTMETSWGKAMKRPQSLSNVATALSQNGFPSLVTEGKPVNNLPAGSVWAKKSRSVMQAPPNQNNRFDFKVSAAPDDSQKKQKKNKQPSTVPKKRNDLSKDKKEPVTPWPEEPVPASWEDRDVPAAEEMTPQRTLKDMMKIMDMASKKKEDKKKKKQPSTVLKKADDLLEDRKEKLEAAEFLDPFPSLPSQTDKSEAGESSTGKSWFSLSELLSSALGFTKDDKKEPQKTVLEGAASKSAVDASSFGAFSAPAERPLQKVVANEQSGVVAEERPLGLGSPPGLYSMELAPPPGFGPPPGFDISGKNPLAEGQVSAPNEFKSNDKSSLVEVSETQGCSGGGRKKSKKLSTELT